MNQKKPYLAIDLDGTLAEYTEWKGESIIGDPIPGAVEFLRRLAERYSLVIFSARASSFSGKDAIHKWVIHHKLRAIITDITNEKKYHFVAYIDDRAIPFKEANDYNTIAEMLLK